MKRVRIESRDGVTRVTDLDTGREIPNCYMVMVNPILPMKVPTATVEVYLAETVIDADAEVITVCPACKGRQHVAA